MILLPAQHLELSAYKGTKKVRETADMLSCKHVFSHRIERIKRMQNESSSEGNQNPWNPFNPMLKDKQQKTQNNTKKD